MSRLTADLEAAASAAEARDAAAALGSLLAAWDRARRPEIADRIARLSRLAAQTAPKELPRKHPVAVHRLVTTPVVRWMKNLLDVVRALKGAPPDPRVADWALAQLETGGNNRTAEEEFLSLLEKHGYPGLAPRVAKAKVKRPRSARRDALAESLRGMKAAELGAAELEALSRVDAALEGLSKSDPKHLLGHVLERPDDLASLQVVADHLCEQGDPRGEFINLQLLHERGGGDDASRKLEASLWRKHWKAWYPELAALLAPTTTRCRGGMLWRAGIHSPEGAPTAEVFSQASFRTVREIVVHDFGTTWVRHDVPEWVEAVWNVPVLALRAYGEGPLEPLPWKRLGLKDLYHRDRQSQDLLGAFPALEVFAADGWGDDLLRAALAMVRKPLKVLCLGLRDPRRLAQDLAALNHAPVGEVRCAATGLSAWDAPEVLLRREADREPLRLVSGPASLAAALRR